MILYVPIDKESRLNLLHVFTDKRQALDWIKRANGALGEAFYRMGAIDSYRDFTLDIHEV